MRSAGHEVIHDLYQPLLVTSRNCSNILENFSSPVKVSGTVYALEEALCDAPNKIKSEKDCQSAVWSSIASKCPYSHCGMRYVCLMRTDG